MPPSSSSTGRIRRVAVGVFVGLFLLYFPVIRDKIFFTKGPSTVTQVYHVPCPPQAPNRQPSTATQQQALNSPNGNKSNAAFSLPDPSYHEYFSRALLEELGPIISNAIYDPDMFTEAVKDPVNYLWDIPFVKSKADQLKAGIPKGLETTGKQLVFLKRSISSGLGRMHRDAAMERTYRGITSEAEFALFDRSVRHFQAAQARYMFIVVQGMIDNMSDLNWRIGFLVGAVNKRAERFDNADPMWYIASQISEKTNWDTVERNVLEAAKISVPKTGRVVHRMERVLSFSYTNQFYHAQHPQPQKFFSMVRPTGSCFSLSRECEHPDGCRFLCNVEFLQSKLQDGKPYGHRFLGVGSANEYDWEGSLVKLFGMTPAYQTPNTIHSITVFDCTLKFGFWVPQFLQDLPVGFGAADICIGRETKDNFMSFAELKKALLDTEKEGQHKVKSPHSDALNLRRFKMGGGAGVPGDDFDGISIFKCDIEGWEFALVPAWARAEYIGLHNNTALKERVVNEKATSNFTMIDFQKEIEFFSVSQFLMEIHANGYDFGSMWQMNHLLLQLHQLGFMQVMQEKNYYGHCCYETVFVHYRYFVRSEMYVRQRNEDYAMLKRQSDDVRRTARRSS